MKIPQKAKDLFLFQYNNEGGKHQRINDSYKKIKDTVVAKCLNAQNEAN